MRFLISISLSFIISNTNLVASEKLFPNYIMDVDGNELSFSSLAENKTVCLITLKSINFPTCLEQLKRFKEKITEFQKCNLTFVVLAYAENKSIKALITKVDFPFPFIQDVDFMISKKLNLDNQPFELKPAIILFNGDRTIKWKKIGRSNQYFSDQAIEDYLDCDNWI